MKRLLARCSRLTLVALATLAAVDAADAAQHHAVYVIGDSLSDTGNFAGLPPALNPIGYPGSPYAERFSNGPVWAEYFAEKLGVPLDSRAYGGALAPNPLGFTNYNNAQYAAWFPAPLPGIASEVAELLADYPEGLNPEALYVVWAGANDVFLGLGVPSLMGTLLSGSAATTAQTVCDLGAAGARHFIVANLPDLGLTPLQAQLAPYGIDLTALSATFNGLLDQELSTRGAACAETLVTFDAFEALQELVAAAPESGLDATQPCVFKYSPALIVPNPACTDPDAFLFWDDVHPTTAGHALLADRFRAAFCGTGTEHPGLRGAPQDQPPATWRGVCYGSK